jgi:hypothetical protein
MTLPKTYKPYRCRFCRHILPTSLSVPRGPMGRCCSGLSASGIPQTSATLSIRCVAPRTWPRWRCRPMRCLGRRKRGEGAWPAIADVSVWVPGPKPKKA